MHIFLKIINNVKKIFTSMISVNLLLYPGLGLGLAEYKETVVDLVRLSGPC